MMMMVMMIEDLQWMEEFNGGGRIKPLFPESSMNVEVERGWENLYEMCSVNKKSL